MEELTQRERFMRKVRGEEYKQNEESTKALQESATSNKEYFLQESIRVPQIHLENQYQFDVFKKVLTECIGNLYVSSLVIDNPESYSASLHEAVADELNTLWIGTKNSKDIFAIHEGASAYIQEAMILAETISLQKVNEYSNSILQEGIGIKSMVSAVKGIKAKVMAKMKEQKAQREKKDAEMKRANKIASATYVPKAELLKERNDFRKSFFKILNKYPKLKTNFRAESAEIYDDQFDPLYDFNVVYGDIFTYNGKVVVDITPELESMFAKFHAELDAITLKFHELNIEYQCDYYFYQLYTDSSGTQYTIVNPDALHENVELDSVDTPIYESCGNDSETVQPLSNEVFLNDGDKKLVKEFEEINGKEDVGQEIQDRVVNVYKAEEAAGADRKEKAQGMIDDLAKINGTLNESTIMSGMNTFGATPSTIFHALFNNRCKQSLNESASCNFNDDKDKILAETISLYTLLECFNGLGLTNMTSMDKEKLKTQIHLS